VLEKSLKVLESSFKNSRFLKVLEKSLIFYQQVLRFAHAPTKITQNCYHHTSFVGSQCCRNALAAGGEVALPQSLLQSLHGPPDSLAIYDRKQPAV